MDELVHAPHLWRLSQVLKATGLKRSTAYRYAKLGLFPRPVKIGPRASAWRRDLIEAWILKQINASR